MACRIDISNSEVLTGCPDDNAQLLLINTTGDGFLRLPWGIAKNCLFGVEGILIVYGSQLDDDNKYFLSGIAQKFLIFANNLARFILIDSDEWAYTESGGAVNGFEIKIGYLDDDAFIVIPNPNGNED